MNQWRLIIHEPGDAAFNMAADEAILAACGRDAVPTTLRLYGWDPAAVSIGYFQDAEKEIDLDYCASRGWPVVRRLTGGRAVLHCDELTYSVSAPVSSPLFPHDVAGTYRVIAEGLLAGLHRLGIPAEIIAARDKVRATDAVKGSAACFSSISWYELAVGGKKVAGSAQRRWARAFLQHGSLLTALQPREQPGLPGLIDALKIRDAATLNALTNGITSLYEAAGRDIPRVELIQAIRDGFEEALGINLLCGTLTAEEEQDAARLMTERYCTAAWNLTGPRAKRPE